MITEDQVFLVHYCHPDCRPLQNICRLPEAEAYRLAKELANTHPDTTAFYRFADFHNYYPRRMAEDRRLYEAFRKKGGNPAEEHPLSFVVAGSDYLHHWFGDGRILRLSLSAVSEEAVSFTYGDSCAAESEHIVTKSELLRDLGRFDTMDAFLHDLHTRCHYIEVQLWDDRYCAGILE